MFTFNKRIWTEPVKLLGGGGGGGLNFHFLFADLITVISKVSFDQIRALYDLYPLGTYGFLN